MQYDSEMTEFVFDLQRFAGGEKTEEPTAKKRADARKKGQVGRSQELNTAFVLLIGFFSLKLLWDSIYLAIASYTTYVFANLNQPVDTENIVRLFIGIMEILAKTALPIMLFIMLIGLAVNFFQVGLNFNTEAIEFKLDKLNPINGFGRIFSKRSLVELAKSFFKILVIGFFLYRFIHFVGRWSMIDVFVVALLGALVHGRFAQINPAPGIFAFAAVVIFTMLATETYDIRLLWDNYRKQSCKNPKSPVTD